MTRRHRLLGGLAALAVATAAGAVVIFSTNGPFGGAFGLWGADLSAQQSAAERFPVASDHVLTNAKVWLMNNSSSAQAPVTLRLELDAVEAGLGGTSRPSGIALEEWTFPIATLGWTPVQHVATSKARPPLRAGRKYWIVASSSAASGQNPVWNFASAGSGFTAISQANGSWAAGTTAALTLVVNGDAGAPARGDLDRDGAVGALDLAALLAAWGLMQPEAGLADANQDGIVNAGDLAILLAAWSATR